MGQPGKKTAYLTAAVCLLVFSTSAISFREKIRLQLYRWRILPHPALRDPSLVDKKAPDKFKARFATTRGDFTRATQLFINCADNARLDGMGFSPFGVVTQGMEVVDAIHKGYGEGAPSGQGPNQHLIQTQGNKYLRDNFPKLDYIKTASIVP